MKTLSLLGLSALMALSACSENPADHMPDQKNWLAMAVKTSDGGMLRGNPKAKVKLVVYSAFSCSDCARFAALSNRALELYVANGNVSYEFRNLHKSPTDLPASLIARCGEPKTFFVKTEQLFRTQAEWRGGVEAPTTQDASNMASFPPELLSTVLAAKLGLDKFGEQQGLGANQIKACLTDKAAIAELDKVTDTAKLRYKVTALPAFLINGQRVTGGNTWEAVDSALKAAGA